MDNMGKHKHNIESSNIYITCHLPALIGEVIYILLLEVLIFISWGQKGMRSLDILDSCREAMMGRRLEETSWICS